MSFFTEGVYENVTKIDSIIQTLLQVFLPMPEDRKNTKISSNLINLIPSSQSMFTCEDCKSSDKSQNYNLESKKTICDKCYKEKLKSKLNNKN